MAGSQPRVTVVVTTFGYARFLRRALDSLAAQTLGPAIVVVDDGSPDDSFEIARAFADDYPDLDATLVRLRNGGVSRARNRGIALTTTPLVCCLDADDWFAPGAIERMVQAFDDDFGASIVRPCITAHFEATGEEKYWGWPSLPNDWERLLRQNTSPYGAMFPRAAWAEVGGYDETLPAYEDWEFWMSLCAAGHVMTDVAEPLLHYRVSDNGLFSTQRHRDAQLRAHIVLRHPDLYDPETVAVAEGISADRPLSGDPPHPIFDRPWWSDRT